MANPPPSETGGGLLNGQSLLDGFGFLVGQLIGGAPMVFPGEQDLFMILELTAEFGGLIPVVGQLLALIAEIIIIVLEVIDYLVALFSGVPRAQKTGIVAHRFGTGKSPISQLVSAQIYQLLNYEGKVLSSSIPADQTTFGEIRHQAEVMLQVLGASQQAATKAIDNVWNNTTSGTEPLPNILDQPLPIGWMLIGNKIIQQMYIDHYNQLVSQGAGPKTAAKKATQYVLHHAPQKQLLKIRLAPQPGFNPCPPGLAFNPQTGKCMPSEPPPPCPPGFQRDPTTGKCIPTTIPPICPPGYQWDTTTQQCIPIGTNPPPNPCQPANDGTGDTLQDSSDCTNQNLLVIQQQLKLIQQSIMGGGGSTLDPVTCTQLGGYVSTLNVSLQAIATALAAAASGGTPVDLTTVVTQLEAIASAISALTTPAGKALNVNLTSSTPLATATATAPATDVSGIVKALATIADQGDVDQSILDALQQAGLITPADLQQLQGIKWSDALAYLINSTPVRTVMKFLAVLGTDIDTLANALKQKLTPAGNWAETKIIGAAVKERNAIQDVIAPILAGVVSSLKPPGPTQLGVINVNPDTVLADVAAVGINLYIMTALVGLLFPGAAEQLDHIIEVTTGLLGFEELEEVQIGPLVQEGIRKQAIFQARAKFQQELPSTSTMLTWVAQGLFDERRAKALSLFNGTPDEIYPIQSRAQYRGLNPRQMLRLIETNLFSGAEIADELTFAAMRPVSQHRMLLAAPYLATASERSSLRATIESAGTAGLLDDQSLVQALDAAESNTDRDSLILAKVHLQQLIQETKDLETEYTTMFTGGIITDATFRGFLQGIGLQPWKVNTVAAKAEARANAALLRKEMAAAAALQKATTNAERAAAKKNFMNGTIDAAALAAALIATGLTAVQAAAWVDLAVLQRGGGLRWQYGLQLSPAAAILLRSRVTALVDQRKRLQITDAQFVSALQALGLGPRYVNALQASTDAMITPKASAVVIPVKTN